MAESSPSWLMRWVMRWTMPWELPGSRRAGRLRCAPMRGRDASWPDWIRLCRASSQVLPLWRSILPLPIRVGTSASRLSGRDIPNVGDRLPSSIVLAVRPPKIDANLPRAPRLKACTTGSGEAILTMSFRRDASVHMVGRRERGKSNGF
jgi:hypothetical protein